MRKLTVADACRIQPQEAQRIGTSWDTEDWSRFFGGGAFGWFAERDGRPLGCAGALPTNVNTLDVWAIVDRQTKGSDMIWITRRIAEWVKLMDGMRLRAVTPLMFLPGRRWLEILGFAQVRVLPQYDGKQDYALFVREIRHGSSGTPPRRPRNQWSADRDPGAAGANAGADRRA